MEDVLGHYSCVQGSPLQPLLAESSALFRAIVEDNASALLAPTLALKAEALRLHNVLHWTSPADEQPAPPARTSQSGQAEGAPSSAAQQASRAAPSTPVVSVKQRTLLALAAYHGSVKALQVLLSVKGVDPRQKMPDGHTARTMAQMACGDNEDEVLALLSAAEAATASASPPRPHSSSGSGNITQQPSASLGHAASVGSASRLFPLGIATPAPVPAPVPAPSSFSPHPRRANGPAPPVLADAAAGAGDELTAAAMPLGGGSSTLAGYADSSTPLGAGSCTSEQGTYPISVDLQHHLSLQHQEAGEGDTSFNPQEGLPYSTSELMLPEYSTDEFRMFAFKVLRCSKRFAHDWRACPFAHPTENARRRDPREFRYCALACPDYKQGFCIRGDLCPYAHGVFEAWLHPSRYRTQLCKDGVNCHRPICFFAHSLPELRTPTHTWMPSGALGDGSGGSGDASATAASALGSPGHASGSVGGGGGGGSGLVTGGMPGAAAGAGKSGAGGPHLPHLAGVKPMIEPGAALSASGLFGFTAPRMSNAFARRHGLNPKDNAMLNLQKIALQVQPGSTVSEQLGRMFTGQPAGGGGGGSSPMGSTGAMPPAVSPTASGAYGGAYMPPPALHLQQQQQLQHMGTSRSLDACGGVYSPPPPSPPPQQQQQYQAAAAVAVAVGGAYGGGAGRPAGQYGAAGLQQQQQPRGGAYSGGVSPHAGYSPHALQQQPGSACPGTMVPPGGGRYAYGGAGGQAAVQPQYSVDATAALLYGAPPLSPYHLQQAQQQGLMAMQAVAVAAAASQDPMALAALNQQLAQSLSLTHPTAAAAAAAYAASAVAAAGAMRGGHGGGSMSVMAHPGGPSAADAMVMAAAALTGGAQ